MSPPAAPPPRPHTATAVRPGSRCRWTRRAIFALALDGQQLLLSDDLTSDSRILLHRDVHERLGTLAPFIQWDGDAFPLTAGDHIVYVVDGYTTSSDYPFAQQVALGGSQVTYARASVRATVDAYSGEIALYVTNRAIH